MENALLSIDYRKVYKFMKNKMLFKEKKYLKILVTAFPVSKPKLIAGLLLSPIFLAITLQAHAQVTYSNCTVSANLVVILNSKISLPRCGFELRHCHRPVQQSCNTQFTCWSHSGNWFHVGGGFWLFEYYIYPGRFDCHLRWAQFRHAPDGIYTG